MRKTWYTCFTLIINLHAPHERITINESYPKAHLVSLNLEVPELLRSIGEQTFVVMSDVMETDMPDRWNIDNRIIAGYAELPLDEIKKLKKWKVM